MKCTIGILIRMVSNLYIVLHSLDILMMLILPVYEHCMCFHLFVFSSISFFSLLYFSNTGFFFMTLVKCILRCFIILEATVIDIVFHVSLSQSFLLAYKYSTYFWLLILYSATLLNSLISSSIFLVETLGFWVR